MGDATVTIDAQSKPDTRYLNDYAAAGSITALRTDIGQWRTNLTDATTYAHEATSARTAITVPRTIELRVEADNKSSGIVLNHGNDAGTVYGYRVRVDSGVVEFYGNTALLGSIAWSDDGPLLIRWATREDPDNPGDVIHEIDVWDEAAVAWAGGLVLTNEAEPFVLSSARFTLGAGGLGVDAYSDGPDAIRMVRISTRYHSREEFYADWIATATPATPTSETRISGLALDGTTLGDEGHFAGPALLSTHRATIDNAYRLWSPVVNDRLRTLDADAFTSTAHAYSRQPPKDGAGYRMWSHLLRVAILPVQSTHVRVRVFVKKWKTSGAAQAIAFRCYSMSKIPGQLQIVTDPPPPQPAYYYSGATLGAGVDHGIGGFGEWVDLGAVKLARAQGGAHTYLALAASFVAGANTTAQRFLFYAWTADPLRVIPGAGEFGGFEEAGE